MTRRPYRHVSAREVRSLVRESPDMREHAWAMRHRPAQARAAGIVCRCVGTRPLKIIEGIDHCGRCWLPLPEARA